MTGGAKQQKAQKSAFCVLADAEPTGTVIYANLAVIVRFCAPCVNVHVF
jgi:hypothetical protein